MFRPVTKLDQNSIKPFSNINEHMMGEERKNESRFANGVHETIKQDMPKQQTKINLLLSFPFGRNLFFLFVKSVSFFKRPTPLLRPLLSKLQDGVVQLYTERDTFLISFSDPSSQPPCPGCITCPRLTAATWALIPTEEDP